MVKNKTIPRLYVTSALKEAGDVILGKDQTHYLRTVMRLKVGDSVKLFNGDAGEWLCSIVDMSKKSVQLVCIERIREQSQSGDLWYLFSPLKQARLDYIAQKATEMGASMIQPIRTDYTQVSRLKEERLRANTIEAAEQCGLLNVPEMSSMMTLEERIDAWPKNRTLIFCNETQSPTSPIGTLKKITNKSLAVLIGPEGGFSPSEVNLMLSCDFVVPISLGPRILRADTAGVAALAVIQSVIGDWEF